MRCPRCGHNQPDSPECGRCGIVIAKFLARQQAPAGVTVAPGDVKAPPSGAGDFRARLRAVDGLAVRTAAVCTERMFPLSRPRQRFFHSLARMIASGIPLIDGLGTIETNSTGVVRRLAAAGRRGLEGGLGLSASLRAESRLLTPLALALIEAGEQTGDLVPMLDELARIEEEKDAQLRGLLTGLAYPLTVLVLSCLITPLPELVLGGTSDYILSAVGNLLTLAGVGAAVWLAVAFSGPVLGPFLDRLPGDVERFLFPSRAGLFFLIVGACIRTGMSIHQALELAEDVFRSEANRVAVRGTADGVREGKRLADGLGWLCRAEDRVLVVAGEQSGTMDRAFGDLARMHLERATRRRRVVTVVASTLVAVAVVGWIASSIVSSYQRQMEAPMQELEREMNREMRGIWNDS